MNVRYEKTKRQCLSFYFLVVELIVDQNLGRLTEIIEVLTRTLPLAMKCH